MKYIFCCLLLTLTACGSLTSIQNPITRERLYAAEAAYGAAQVQAQTYHTLPRCPDGTHFTFSNPCKEPPVIRQIKIADARVHGTLLVARKFVKENPTLDATSVILNVENAVAAFKALTSPVTQ